MFLFRFAALLIALAVIGGYSAPETAEAAADAIPVQSTGALFTDADGNTVAIPEGYAIDTTPVICWDFQNGQPLTCVPEEAPDGTYVTDWADNSPIYGDADWMLIVNDTDHTAAWEYIGSPMLSV